MASRDSLPNAAALEQIEAPTKEVAAAKRQAAEAEAADKPALKDAVETLRRLQVAEDPTLLAPVMDAGGWAEQPGPSRGPRGTRRGLGPGPVREETSPSLARVLAAPDADSLAEDTSDAVPDEATSTAPPLSRLRPTAIVGGVVLALAIILGVLAAAVWGSGEIATTASPSAQGSAPTASTAPMTKQTTPVTAIATATVEPLATSAAVTADPVRSTSTKASSRASAKASTTVEVPVATSVRSNPPAPASSLPPGWNPNI